jgi:hypothetical protein
MRAKNPYDEAIKLAASQGFFAPVGAQNDTLPHVILSPSTLLGTFSYASEESLC